MEKSLWQKVSTSKETVEQITKYDKKSAVIRGKNHGCGSNELQNGGVSSKREQFEFAYIKISLLKPESTIEYVRGHILRRMFFRGLGNDILHSETEK